MNPSRIDRLRSAAQFGLPITVEPAELTEMLDAVQVRHNQEPADPPPVRQEKTFTRWLMELETISGCCYSAKHIRWWRENAFAKGLTPAKALKLTGAP